MASATDPTAAAGGQRARRGGRRGPRPNMRGRDWPRRLGQLRWSTWREVVARSVKGFMTHNCADWAAALTYYGVLALFPSAVVIVALVGLVSEGGRTIDTITTLGRDIGAGSVVASDGFTNALKGVVDQRSSAKVLLSAGLGAALWSASGYVGAFTRASNAIYRIEEGRPFYKLRPQQLALTAVALILMAVVATTLIVSGPVADAVGNALHLGSAPRIAWSIAKWPMLVAIMILLLSLLFWIAPNVRQPRFRWLTVGGAVALISWAIASIAFGFYVSNFGSYDATYGSLGAIIAFLVWLFLSNCALMFGVEINAELQQGRAIQGGAPPKAPVLPPKAPAQS
jgi:membrane protein